MFLDGDGGQNGRFMLFWVTSLAGTPLDTHTHPEKPVVGGCCECSKGCIGCHLGDIGVLKGFFHGSCIKFGGTDGEA